MHHFLITNAAALLKFLAIARSYGT